jgi:NADPH-dependent 2,4-dienoyl-CoA reductase/sulfur reductase-like enzyme
MVVARDLQSGEIFEQPYNKLVLATGSRPRIPAWAQEKADNLFTLRTYADAERLKTYLDQHPVRQAVVVGAGYIGLEIAEALHQRGIRTAIVEQASRPFAAWSEALVEPLIQTVQQHDIALHCNCSVTGVRYRTDTSIRSR